MTKARESVQKLQPLRGMKDLFGVEFKVHDYIINAAKKIGSLYCYEGASTPILEYTGVFDRTLGGASDVVSKEMYSFLDRSGSSVSLRPEFTAGIMRAFISEGLQQKVPLKLFSYGPLFRYDRPQAGRQRQFHQVNFEHIGSDAPYDDAEVIKLAASLLLELGLSDYITIELNSLGCKQSRAAYQEALTSYFGKYENELSEDSRERLKKNPLRILDSKDERDRSLASEAPLIADYYTPESRNYFEKVREYLEIFGVNYKLNPRLARGLDYYCHTAFEFTTDKLGAQNAVGGGGRYDYLCQVMGGSSTPAIGFACGLERLALMLEAQNFEAAKLAPVYLVPIGPECESYMIKLANTLRLSGIATSVELKGKVQKRMEKALKNNAKYIVFAGSDEMTDKKFKLKILDQKEEKLVSEMELTSLLCSH